MSGAYIGCPVSRYGGQRPCQNHGASARTDTRTKTPGRVGWRRAKASRISGVQALRTGMSCARVCAAVGRCKAKTRPQLSP